MRIRSIARSLKSVLPDKAYSLVKTKLSPIYQRMNYACLPLVIRKRSIMTLDKKVLGRFIVSTANGLFLIENNTFFELLEGNFYGVALWRDNILVYLTYGHKGRIISFPSKSAFVKERCVYVLDGLPHGCHQVDCTHDRLYITDTYNNRIIEFDLKTRNSADYYPCGRLLDGRHSPNYAHINSIYFRDGEIFNYCHNETSKTGKQSTILISDLNFNKKEIVQTGSGNGHNVVFYEGHLYHCDSLGKALKRDDDVVFQTDLFTRGLSISKDCIVLGGSDFAEKDNRANSKGRLYFLTHNFDHFYSFVVPGPVHEVRRIDDKDFASSDWPLQDKAFRILP